jgi:putative ABC transport system permease protein
MPWFLDRLETDPSVSRIDHAPMLRGIISRINDRPAREVAPGHWVVEGDRAISYAETLPERTTLTAGDWWGSDYTGAPQLSFAAEEAAEMGIGLGDEITLNILGRDITAPITSLREVDFSSVGMGFVMLMNPSALAGAPHTFIATVYADSQAAEEVIPRGHRPLPERDRHQCARRADAGDRPFGQPRLGHLMGRLGDAAHGFSGADRGGGGGCPRAHL